MDDIDVGIMYLGEGQQVINALGFDDRWTAFVVPFRPGFAFREKLSLQLENEIGVFTMSGGDDAKFFRESERFVEFLIGDAERACVREIHFDAADPFAYTLPE